ncbi:hypothetical protein [Levilactobacillus tongjiangensis]|uniref:DUF3899 domain-containing protein n=1 Tax=Levilactobacillus tongjiangensis TaxID=2486023 RepID=A0ABW1SRY8_9LACO|nr:hypothetical protein [Levilactobacillus tongjiangensis]
MHFSGRYWVQQASCGLVVIGFLLLLGHWDYATGQLLTHFSVLDGYLMASWVCFPWAKWVVLEDTRHVQAPIIHRHQREQPVSVYEKMQQPRGPVAASKQTLRWYWRGLLDFLLAILAPVILGGFIAYLVGHN